MTNSQTSLTGKWNCPRHSGPDLRRAVAHARTARLVGVRSDTVRGFTAIELLIVVAVVAILVTVALPAYNNTLVRSNRAAAQSYLLDLANRQEQFLLDARTYTTTVNDLLVPPATVSSNYTVTIAVPAGSSIANAYKITATPLATSIQQYDGNLTIDQDGAKTGAW